MMSTVQLQNYQLNHQTKCFILKKRCEPDIFPSHLIISLYREVCWFAK